MQNIITFIAIIIGGTLAAAPILVACIWVFVTVSNVTIEGR